MGRAVRGANTVSAVEHSSHKDEAIAGVSGVILPGAPDIRVGGIGEIIDMRHDSTDDNGDKHTTQNEDHSKVTDIRKELVHEEDDAAAHPGANDEADEDVPRLGDEAGMHEGVHGDSLLTQDGRHGRSTQDPRQTVPETRKETTDTAIFSRRDGSPVVDTTGRGHSRRQFRNGCSNQPVANRNRNTASC